MTAVVIIPHYNDVERLGLCLAALTPQVEAHDGVDVVVVDNASPIDLSVVRAQYPWARFEIEEARGAAAARNCGVTRSTAEYLFFLDADCVPTDNWLATAMDAARSADIIGGRIDTFDETPPPRSGAEAFEAVFAFDQKSYVEKKRFSVTANLLTSRDVFEAVGPFKPGVPEDKDWCQRAVASGRTLSYVDTLRVGHPTRRDWPALKKKWLRLAREAYGATDQSTGGKVRWLARALIVGLSVFLHAPKLMFSPRLRGLGERWRGVATLIRLRLARAVWMVRLATETPPAGA